GQFGDTRSHRGQLSRRNECQCGDEVGLPLGRAGHYISSVANSARPPRSLATLFESDPYAAVIRVLRDNERAINAAEIKQVLRDAGVVSLDKNQWTHLQKRLRGDDHVIVDQRYRYSWVAEPPTISPGDALQQLIRAAGALAKPSYVDVVRRALIESPNELEVE